MSTLLDQIKSPEDFRGWELDKLNDLAAEIRKRIISVISTTGGHLAPSLGVIELTIALHYVFDTPKDKLIWDVGHQTYAHKILTGRNDRFPTLRQENGLSGFPRMDESQYDSFGTGHASTSISAALGFAAGNDVKNEKHRVIAVIGDGALTGGLALEGLNNAGSLGKNLTVVLNDNKYSISPNVGALSRSLTDIITTQAYNRLKNDIWEMTGHIPAVGERMRKIMSNVEKSLKSLFIPGILFEKMGFRYIGPDDGHNIQRLIHIFEHVKDLPGCTLVHVYTTKGKGYTPAEEDAPRFHGTSAFIQKTGELKKKNEVPTYSEVFGSAIVELAETRPDVVAITAAMTDSSGLCEFSKRFPDRFFDVGIAEGHAVTFAGGLAASGRCPVVAIYSTFLQRAIDNIIHDVAIQNLHVVFALDRSGVVGEDGMTHHGLFDLSYMRMIPGMVVMAPKDENELRSMLKLAIDDINGPVSIRYPRGFGNGMPVSSGFEDCLFGKAERLKEGKNVTLLAIGSMVSVSLEAAVMLEGKKISAEVINMRFVKPLDEDMLMEVGRKKKNNIVTIEENVLSGGFGSAVSEFYTKKEINEIRLLSLGLPDDIIGQATRQKLLQNYGLNPGGIAASVERFLKGK